MPRKKKVKPLDLSPIDDFEAYVGVMWSITNKAGDIIPFLPNAAQRIVLAEIRRLEAAGKPVRLKILKGRQPGVSLLITAWVQHRVQTRPGTTALSLADKANLPAQWLRRAQGWHAQTASALRPEATASNALELYFRDMGSRYFVGSEKGTTPGMGLQLTLVHLSELFAWTRYAKITTDLFPSVPYKPGTAIIQESTGDMEGDEWHKQIMLTLEGKDDYTMIFLPWFLDAGYTLDKGLTPADYTPEEREFVGIADKWATDNPEHAKLAEYSGITPGQMAWRRSMIRNDFSGDLDVFKTRHPAQIHEAFLGIGSLALPVGVVRHHRSTVREPLARVQFERDAAGKVIAVPFKAEGPVENWPPHWRIWAMRKEFCEYAIGADVAVGRLSDQADSRSNRDSSVIGVLNRREIETTAEYSGEVQTDRLAEQMLLAGEYYNDAWMAPEVNNPGLAVLDALKTASYANIMYRSTLPDQAEDRELSLMGWHTGDRSRPLLISDWITACREELIHGYEGKVRAYSALLAAEEQTFVKTKTGKAEHRPGCHDDALFAWMIALQVHLLCPHVRAIGAAAQREADAQKLQRTQSMSYTGGYDTEIDELFEGEDDY